MQTKQQAVLLTSSQCSVCSEVIKLFLFSHVGLTLKSHSLSHTGTTVTEQSLYCSLNHTVTLSGRVSDQDLASCSISALSHHRLIPLIESL